MRRRHVLSWVLVSALLAAGCSGDDDADGADSTTVTGGEPASTTEPADSTAPTSDVDTTAPTTTPTTQAPTTTTLPVEEQVRPPCSATTTSTGDAFVHPSECDPLEVAVPDSDAFNALTAGRDDLVEGNYFVGPEDVGYMVITAIEPPETTPSSPPAGAARPVLYFQPPIPDAPPTVQNNTPGSSIETYQFVQMPDLTWKVRRGDTVGDRTPKRIGARRRHELATGTASRRLPCSRRAAA